MWIWPGTAQWIETMIFQSTADKRLSGGTKRTRASDNWIVDDELTTEDLRGVHSDEVTESER
jgi:hypothetical protein